ncbi:putative lipid II flippase MurJ [Commensalibacter sp. Nvir]|uniref:murein biosynthesis integral membrane protein MurJ n=1 Tax=Commensalibacter sp. Nvir TaxID=3069817 RepID=UPI002D2FACD6|nr:putative lipid II flippase MurJ [Commensalibacter sp. Nvir]
MIKNFLTVGSWTMASRFLGLIRDQLLAALLGAGPLQDAYQVAFRLPNMFRRLFGEGAFNAAFVPLFTATLTHKGKHSAEKFANESFSILIATLLIITILGEIFMPQVLRVIAPGFSYHQGRYQEAIILSRITFPYMVLICAAALISGILNSLHQFGVAAAAYISFNIVGIAALLWLTPLMPNAAWAAAWGVTLSGIVQFLILWIALQRAHITISFSVPKITQDIKQLLKKMAPGIVGSGITQINLTVDTIIATLLPTGSVSVMYFADRINQLPLGVLGAAAGTTLLPILTKDIHKNDMASALNNQNKAIDYTLILTIPAAFGLFALAVPIISALFGHGKFTPDNVYASAQSLQAYALGLPAFVLIKVLSPGFFARGDTATPVKIGLATLLLNFFLNLLFMKPLAHMGPPLASSLAAMINVFILAVILYKRQALYIPRALIKKISVIVFCSIIMACCLLLVKIFYFSDFIEKGLLYRLFTMVLLACMGSVIYGLLLQVFGIISINYFFIKILKKIVKK